VSRAVVIVDGEHYPPVVRDALAELPYTPVAVVLAGGGEKLREPPSYGVPLAASLEAAVAEHDPDVVLDLSDEPVLGPVERLALASRALALGLPYEGADFRFEPPSFAPFRLPAIAVLGTGKRVGKTAAAGRVARTLARSRSVVVVAMGRGGPPDAELVDVPPALGDLVARSRAGRHAASDHLETALAAGVPTVGCRRAGGGLAGAVWVSNVAEGAALAASLRPDVVVFDGSGAAVPPVAAGARVLVVGPRQPAHVATGYLNAYRHRIADLVLVVGGDPAVVEAARTLTGPRVPVVRVGLEPRPLAPVRGRRAAFFGTAAPAALGEIAARLRDVHGADVVHASSALADRPTLREELDRVDADVFLVELKAAAIDVVAEEALARGAELVIVAHDVVPLEPGVDLDREIERLAVQAAASVAETV